MKRVRPYVQYSVMATKQHPIISLFADYDVSDSGDVESLHGQVKSDLLVDGKVLFHSSKRINFQVPALKSKSTASVPVCLIGPAQASF